MNPNNTVSSNDGDINLTTLEYIIKEEEKRLQEDRLRLQLQKNIEARRKRRSDGNHDQPLYSNTLPKNQGLLLNNVDVSGQVRDKCLLKDNSTIYMIKNPREEEINKFVNAISKPKELQSFTSKNQRKSYPQARFDYSPVNVREKEKDKLCETFASSECPLTKPSSRQIAKNLYSSITFNDFKLNNLEKENKREQVARNVRQEYINGVENNTNVEAGEEHLRAKYSHYNVNSETFKSVGNNTDVEDREEYLRKKYNHPRIVISHHKESCQEADIGDNKMVRIGEFSPLNPNLPGGATVLGLGEWDEKRQLLLQKYRQVSRSPSPSPSEHDHSHNQRSIATQTDLVDDWSSERSPQYLYQHPSARSQQSLHGDEDEDKQCVSPQSRLSPIPKRFENMTEKEVREFIYRRDLAKQIEEKNKLKEEMRKKEAEEEAKIEAKIQRDLEKMRRQYEEERLQRLELAIKRTEQEDFLKQRLAIEQQKTLKENKIIKKKSVKYSDLADNSHTQYEKGTQSDFKRSSNKNIARAPYSRSLPEQAAASALSSVHEELRQPLLQPPSSLLTVGGLESYPPEDTPVRSTSPYLQKTKISATNVAKSPPISVLRSKEVDMLAQKAVFDTNSKPPQQIANTTSNLSGTARDMLKEVDNILKQPLLPESRVLPPVSQPLIHATIPPLSASLQVPRGTSLPTTNRSNADILEDKWKVPYVEQDTEAVPNTKHNPRILTQLGTFRKQLQEESLRMRQRVREDSP